MITHISGSSSPVFYLKYLLVVSGGIEPPSPVTVGLEYNSIVPPVRVELTHMVS